MHRTIVHNKIINSICSFLFFHPTNIYYPSLGKVRLGWPNPKPIQLLNFYPGKKTFYSELYVYNGTAPNF